MDNILNNDNIDNMDNILNNDNMDNNTNEVDYFINIGQNISNSIVINNIVSDTIIEQDINIEPYTNNCDNVDDDNKTACAVCEDGMEDEMEDGMDYEANNEVNEANGNDGNDGNDGDGGDGGNDGDDGNDDSYGEGHGISFPVFEEVMTIPPNFQINNPQNFQINEQALNEMIENKHNEIMNYSYSNMTNVDDNIIKFIDICYLKNLQYDEQPIDTIIFTIRTAFGQGTQFELKNLVSNFFSYGMLGINYVFNANFDILNELLSSELKRHLRRSMFLDMISQIFISGTGFGPMEDVKLILTQEELDKIPKNSYKELSLELKEKNTSCPVCREEYRENDEVRTLKCNHVFHTDCVDNWLINHSHKCPCCRQETGNYKPNI